MKSFSSIPLLGPLDCIQSPLSTDVKNPLLVHQLVCPSVVVHSWTSLIISSLLFQQFSVWLVCLTWMACEMGCKWSYSGCFVGWYFQDLAFMCSYHEAVAVSVRQYGGTTLTLTKCMEKSIKLFRKVWFKTMENFPFLWSYFVCFLYLSY